MVPPRFRGDPCVWAAWLYFQEGLNQEATAEVMGVSRATVNGYIGEARRRGIVSVAIDPQWLSSLDMGRELSARFGLQDCVVIPDDGGARPLAQRIGEAGAVTLQQVLRPGSVIGVAWGRTVMALADNMSPRSASGASVPDLSVIHITGSTTATFAFSPERCASTLAARLGARSIGLVAPAVVSSALVREIFLAEPILREQFEILRNADVLVFGVCTTAPDSLIYTSGLFDAASTAECLAHGGTAVIAGRFVDAAGFPIHSRLDDRTIGLPLPEFARVPTRIAVAGGLDKVPALIACMKGGYPTIVVTDATTATAILDTGARREDLDAAAPRGRVVSAFGD